MPLDNPLFSYLRSHGFSRGGLRRGLKLLKANAYERPRIGWSVQPISRAFGSARGTPIDRYYMEGFLRANQTDVRGKVLEIGDDRYFRKFASKGSSIDVLHVQPRHPGATITGDLGSEAFLDAASYAFDCIVCTQVLQCIYPVQRAVVNLYAMLRPGGVILATASGISQISRFDMNEWGEYWRFTSRSLTRIFEQACPGAEIAVQAHGNVMAAVGFLHGMSAEEIGAAALDQPDPDYEVNLCIRCRKPA